MERFTMRDTNTHLGRPRAPRIDPLHGGIINALQSAKNLLGVGFQLWAKVVEISIPTYQSIIVGSAPLTFTTASAIHRIGIMLDVPPNGITDHQLPLIPFSVTEAALDRLRQLKPTPFVAAFCARRLRELKSGEVIDRLNAFAEPGAWQLAVPRKPQGSGNSHEE